MRAAQLAALLALRVAACAPAVDGPAERQRALDRDDADRLAAQLAALPGAVRAEVVLHRGVVDPLAPAPSPPGAAAAVVVVDDRADRDAVAAAARRLVHAAAPELADASIAVELGATRPTLARVGPFIVDARSKAALVATLAAALALIAALAGWLAWRTRPAR